MVYGRARDEAHESIRAQLRIRADILSGLLELEGDEFELELPIEAMPEYEHVGSGTYFTIVDCENAVIGQSPSLGDETLPAPPPWEENGVHIEEIEDGPGGRPCALISLSFRVPIELVDDDGEPMPVADWLEEQLRFRVQVAQETTDREAGLASLAAFLAIAGLLATAVAAVGGLLLARRLMRPVRMMTNTARTMTPEDPTRRLEPDGVVSELHSLALTLNDAFDRLAEALVHHKRFTADASHELRTPATILLSNAELLLRRERTPEEYRKGLTCQVETSKRMAALIEDLLTLARADAGREQLERARVDLASTAAIVCREHSPVAEARGVTLRCTTEPEVRIDGDGRRLTQLVTNLVGNAVKFVQRGGSVRVSVSREGPEAVLTVADDGPGIPEEHHVRIFERFYRVRDNGGTNGKGTGLGLAIAAWIVEAHGGRITVDSRPGEGAAFRAAIPCA